MAAGTRAITGMLVGLSLTELQTIKTNALAAMNTILTAHQGYSRPGFSFNRIQFQDAQHALAEANYAIGLLNGTRVTQTVPDFRNC